MHETITAGALVLGILSMLLALYNVKFDRKLAGKFFKAMIALYIIGSISMFTDTSGEELMPHFENGGSLMCKDDTVSKAEGWSGRDSDYLMKDKKIYYIKMCRKI
ncbi:MAG: hypothetical protein OIF32_04110 [Campylobacterales bacterium]|nr:hypothetical protein [Campylobacterales bacterium]